MEATLKFEYEKKSELLRGSDRTKFTEMFNSHWYNIIKSKDFVFLFIFLYGLFLIIGYFLSLLNSYVGYIFFGMLSGISTAKLKLERNEISRSTWEEFLSTTELNIPQENLLTLEDKINSYLQTLGLLS